MINMNSESVTCTEVSGKVRRITCHNHECTYNLEGKCNCQSLELRTVPNSLLKDNYACSSFLPRVIRGTN